MHDQKLNPKQIAIVIDRLLKLGLLTDSQFRQMHHMGATPARFQKYLNQHGSFQTGSRNEQLAYRLQEMLTRGPESLAG